MKAVVQRVKNANLKVDGKLISQIDGGLVVYFGVGKGDTKEKADFLASKISKLRVFNDENGKMNKSVLDVGGEILSVSQFTLYADVSHGNRPGYTDAEEPSKASELYDYFSQKLIENGVPTKKGIFGADMKILQENDGPVTIIYEI
ncbi:MAG: D-tyrosyl-tRNA(Tyr) deacylase [Clostridia bacterium]|nr:D-tyrosyl-tRNA(Tyr) deacylase [Clostridia bacterium]